ncbi:alpha/beta hydrolase [Flavihumibacter fluvii]|uniref:alpha/beta hydrolase n=1 Tax=Flavihumibacter fluvii TaxID=2838157 RepID=UPI001BDDF1DF|nr:alpha/beta hydrolase-fold protein [Flavihumibacter fluvii]ULQ54066.1 alpha/beta hydrolase [Flavihumibacter fluvii]
MRSVFLCTCFCLLLTGFAVAQSSASLSAAAPKAFVLGKTIALHSAALAEDRILNIYTPEIYAQDTTTKFPVIYLLDGSANEDFIHICGLVQFLTMIGSMPPVIVVGIANVDRRRDFTFPTTVVKDKAAYPTTGGSEAFIAFLEKEVQPFIQQFYRANDTSLIIGQSLGGLLATEILFKKPQLFNSYIIVSPSLWWDNESLLQLVPTLQNDARSDALHIFITVGKEGTQMENNAADLYAAIKKHALKNSRCSFQPLLKENHLTILHQAVYTALVWRFKK